ncbi:MAG: AIM24 family protein, partial [Acidobacteriota bacterium]
AAGEAEGSTPIWWNGQAEWKPISDVAPQMMPPAAEPATTHTPAPEPTPEPAPEPEPAPAAAEPAKAEPAAAASSSPVASPIESREDLEHRLPVVVQRRESFGTVFEVLRAEEKQMARIEIQGDRVHVEGGAMHYMRGHISIDVPKASAKNFLKAAATNEGVRPIYSGNGEIFLEPTTGEINLLELNGESWVLDKGAFLAADDEIEVGVFVNKGGGALLGGEGVFQTQVSGRGKVLYNSWGPVQKLELQNERLTVDGSFAVARSASLSFKVEKATKGLIAAARSGEGLVNVIEGTGTVMIAPVANRYYRPPVLGG